MDGKDKPPCKYPDKESSKAVVMWQLYQSEWYEEKEPHDVEGRKNPSCEERTDKELYGYWHQLELFDFLCRCLCQHETYKEIKCDERNHSSINQVKSLNRTIRHGIAQDNTEEQEISAPKSGKEITQPLHCLILFKHNMALLS